MTVALEAGIVGRDEVILCEFYTRVMGFALVERMEHAAGTVYKFRRGGEARLKIFFSADAVDPVAPIQPWFKPGGWRYAALYLDALADVDALAAAVDASDGEVLIAPTNHRPGARMALVCDPEGNAWELIAET
jgi:catechol 2,3-dioxygenase-like lactoylglutathione lyase family enzyme